MIVKKFDSISILKIEFNYIVKEDSYEKVCNCSFFDFFFSKYYIL